MAKNLKLNIKNSQIAKALKIGGLKSKGETKKKSAAKKPAAKKSADAKKPEEQVEVEASSEEAAKPQRKARARSKSAFDPAAEAAASEELAAESAAAETETEQPAEGDAPASEAAEKVAAEADAPTEPDASAEAAPAAEAESAESAASSAVEEAAAAPAETPAKTEAPKPARAQAKEEVKPPPPKPRPAEIRIAKSAAPRREAAPKREARPSKGPSLGPTGKHIRDILPPKPKPKPAESKPAGGVTARNGRVGGQSQSVPPKQPQDARRGDKRPRGKEYRDLRPARRGGPGAFDSRDKQGLRAGEEERWRKRRPNRRGPKQPTEDTTIRPDALSIRLPITIKDLAAQMKLKASQLISKLFMQGVIVTINDILDDDTTIVLLGEEFQCKITIDTSDEERVRVTGQTIAEEIGESDAAQLQIRPPVVTFMGHVDHGKTSLLDAIRQSNVTSGEAGQITQHMGAFLVHTKQGDVAFLDTPGHEAFSAMRARGAEVTDIVVLVVAGDEGMRQQTLEAIQHAKAAGVTIMVALNKCDKPGFNPDEVYRQLSEQELLPESWGGSTVTVNTSAVTGEGIEGLLEMLALQAEVLELRADPSKRARGTVLESEMHKGFGQVATLLVQNGSLKPGDAIVVGPNWARIKTMRDDHGKTMKTAGPSTPVEITGLSGLPEAGEEFIVVSSEKEARDIAEIRAEQERTAALQRRRQVSLESLLTESAESSKKVLNVVLRADVQGSLEAVKDALENIESDKAKVNVIFHGVGSISESDVQLAAASNAVIIGFHTLIEAHSEPIIKEMGVTVRTFDVIYHAVDGVKEMLTGLLDRVAREEERGQAEVRATFKASQIGTIAGCQVMEGSLSRNHKARLVRDGGVVWTGDIASIKRHQDDVKEVTKGIECGIVLEKMNDIKEGDFIQTYEVVYDSQEL